MVVKTQCKGYAVTGLLVGPANVRRYFSKKVSAIELQLGHLRIECGLPHDFWLGPAELRDARLCAWLELKHFHQEAHAPISLDMKRVGKNSFKLGPLALEPARIRHKQAPLVGRSVA